MNNKKITILGIIGLFVLILIFNTFFIVKQTEQAVVFQFGNPQRVIKKSGLNVKIPFIQNVMYFDTRLQEINTEDKEIIASDQKRLIISAFIKYKIVSPILYYTTVRDEYGFKNKFSTILDSSLRQVIGEIPLNSLLSEKRSSVMEKLQEVVDKKAREFGIEIIDVRITRSDLPKANSEAIYKRMQTEREREAKEIRAEGDETAQKIRANTDKEKIFLIAEAKKQAEILMGEGDATASKIYSKAYSKDPDFFSFYRSMMAYKNSLNSKNTKMIISPDSEFFKEMNNYKQAY
ncbi:MAG: protease modulator HflC [Rickettsiales bacterium]|nr:protease modulator HflC [Rickettsiales bacterium]